MPNENKPIKRGMVVVAHADDAEWGCSGTVAQWCQQGSEVIYVICTDGSKGSDDPNMTSADLAAIRKSEQEAAAQTLGVKEVVFLNYEDSHLEPTIALRRDITRQIRKHKPDILICPNPTRVLERQEYVGHPDHLAAGEATLSAVFPAARDRLTFPELLDEGLEPHRVKELLILENSTDANYWVDVTETMDTAVEALKQHKSQVDPQRAEINLRQSREARGKLKGVRYAETFRLFTFS